MWLKMERSDFLIQIKRLMNRFGEKYYDEGVCQKLWHIIEKLPAEKVGHFVTNACGGHKAPLFPEFTEFELTNRAIHSFPQKHFLGTCGKCYDGMIVAVKRKVESSPYVFKCDCSVGHSHQEQWPTWSQWQNQNFRIDNLPSSKDKTSIFSKEEITEIFSILRGIVTKKISFQDGEQYAKLLREMIHERKPSYNPEPSGAA